jgi:hypothetical protein
MFLPRDLMLSRQFLPMEPMNMYMAQFLPMVLQLLFRSFLHYSLRWCWSWQR